MRLYSIFRPLLFQLEPEQAHDMTFQLARWIPSSLLATVHSILSLEDARLEQEVWGIRFPNPIGLAAGLDKNGVLLPLWEALGAGFVEVGSVTARPSKGNPAPRLFRLPEARALINRMGLNNEGADRIARRLQFTEKRPTIPLGINIAKTHDPNILGSSALEDFRYSFCKMAPLADYIAVNISCPNTEEGKTFEEPEALHDLLEILFEEQAKLHLDVPILIKWSPPFSTKIPDHFEELLHVARQFPVSGFIATNTAPDRKGLDVPPDKIKAIGRGGLSGAPLRPRAVALTRYLYEHTQGEIPIIGVGGIDSVDAAYERIRAGATLLQVFTGLIYEGPGFIHDLKKGLLQRLEADGFSHIQEAIGTDIRLEMPASP